MRRQELNVHRMEMLGARVIAVTSGTKTLKDATSEALRDWVANVRDTFYIIGSVVGPHPYPEMVREFQSVIGRETREQLAAIEGRRPDILLACVGGGSNAIGLFHPFLNDPVRMVGVEAAGLGISTGKHAATLTEGTPGVLHGSLSYLLQDEHGQVQLAHSISAGLDYPGVGPEHSYLKDAGRVEYVATSFALPRPIPTCPLPSPTTRRFLRRCCWRGVKESFRHSRRHMQWHIWKHSCPGQQQTRSSS